MTWNADKGRSVNSQAPKSVHRRVTIRFGACAGVIFDCDGTLVDSEPTHAQALSMVLARYGIGIQAREICSRYAGLDNDSVIRIVSEEAKRAMPRSLEGEIRVETRRLIEMHLSPVQHAIEVVAELRARRINLAVASNSNFEDVDDMLCKVQLRSYFDDRLATRDRVEAPKPAPDVYRLAASMLSAKPEECVAVEDSAAGIAAARSAGIPAVGYCHDGAADAKDGLLGAGASIVIDDLRALLDL
jgi:HAD superfamily hydrolase (TIGR01509 family)